MKLLIKGGTLINPRGGGSGPAKVGSGSAGGRLDVLVEDGVIAAIGADIQAQADKVIGASGLLVLPGLVDMHCHLREPGQEYKEDIESGTLSAAYGGFTSVACMANTSPVIDNAALVSYIVGRAKEKGHVRVYPVGAVTKGLLGKELAELMSMRDAGAVAFSDDGRPIMDGNVMRMAMLYAKGFYGLIISHCEDINIVNGGVLNEGYASTVTGLKGISPAAEEIQVAREALLANALDTRIHIAHVSTRAGVEIIREAKRNGVKITAETAPHYFSATDEMALGYDTNCRVNPPLRGADDMEAIIEGLVDGTIDCIATDHAPHHADEKNVEFAIAASGIAGFETAFALCNMNLVRTGRITMERLVELMSTAPSKILGISGGILREGEPADITVVSEDEKWIPTADGWHGKSANNPFIGKELTGKPVYTIVGGEVVMENIR